MRCSAGADSGKIGVPAPSGAAPSIVQFVDRILDTSDELRFAQVCASDISNG
ncbi:hypothetical protein [Nocardia sp. NPDC057440]|uniref:hypothetical protein n=1 Tax=Nocardia sp. NPDC057440 TaxID=3346134 RepID=UPI003670A880